MDDRAEEGAGIMSEQEESVKQTCGELMEDACKNPANEAHECPFRTEIDDDYTECNCCDACTEQCAMDI
jgi:hypothetical protein